MAYNFFCFFRRADAKSGAFFSYYRRLTVDLTRRARHIPYVVKGGGSRGDAVSVSLIGGVDHVTAARAGPAIAARRLHRGVVPARDVERRRAAPGRRPHGGGDLVLGGGAAVEPLPVVGLRGAAAAQVGGAADAVNLRRAPAAAAASRRH